MSFAIPGWTGTKEQLQMQKEIDESFQKKKTEEKVEKSIIIPIGFYFCTLSVLMLILQNII